MGKPGGFLLWKRICLLAEVKSEDMDNHVGKY